MNITAVFITNIHVAYSMYPSEHSAWRERAIHTWMPTPLTLSSFRIFIRPDLYLTGVRRRGFDRPIPERFFHGRRRREERRRGRFRLLLLNRRVRRLRSTPPPSPHPSHCLLFRGGGGARCVVRLSPGAMMPCCQACFFCGLRDPVQGFWASSARQDIDIYVPVYLYAILRLVLSTQDRLELDRTATAVPGYKRSKSESSSKIFWWRLSTCTYQICVYA